MEDITMSEPHLEKPYDMNDYRADMDEMEQATMQAMKSDMLKIMDKIDDLAQKIINLNTKLNWLARDFEELKNKKNKYGI